MATLKRKFVEDEVADMEEADIEAELMARVAARKLAKITTRPLIKKLQQLYAEWRETEDDDRREDLEDEISEYEAQLAEYKGNYENHSMRDIEDDGHGVHTGKRIRFSERPQVASYLYPEDRQRKKSPRNRHSSEGEIFKHDSEMRVALRDLARNPIFYKGGCTCRNF